MYDNEDFFSFIPIVPLFISKGNLPEENNNGNIAFDASVLPFKGLNIYSELLVDDIISPTSMFDDFWGNKWGFMVGTHYTYDFSQYSSGAILEYSRIEPWVYTHKATGTAQSANQNIPLGNSSGPNSQTIAGKTYFRDLEKWYVSLKFNAYWKGKDLGSFINDIPTEETRKNPKHFLKGAGTPDFSITQYGKLKLFNNFYLEEFLNWNDELFIRVNFQYWI